MSKSTPLIELRNVGLCYRSNHIFYARRRGSFWALDDVSMSVYPGETLGVIGRNGAGKSTLLKTIAGILKPDRGDVHLRAARIALLSLQIGFVPHLTGRENIILSGLLLGFGRREIKQKMDEIIQFAELGEFIHQPIDTYSTGMRARLGFAIAFHTNPDVLLVDETLGVGDASFKKKSTLKMKERIQSNNTVVLVSHNAKLIGELCDRVVWIENGRSLMEGDAETVLEAYAKAPPLTDKEQSKRMT